MGGKGWGSCAGARLLEELDDLEGDGGGAGDAGRVDARRVDELRLGLAPVG